MTSLDSKPPHTYLLRPLATWWIWVIAVQILGGVNLAVWELRTPSITETLLLSINPAMLPNPTAGSSYSQQLAVSGGHGSEYVFSATGLPSGLTIDPGGLISGSPTVGTPATVLVTATDRKDTSITRTYSVAVNPAISVSPPALPDPTIGSAYSLHLTASGGSGSGYHYSATGLPAGFSISPDGLITGTPTSGAPATVFVTVTDSNVASITRTYSLTANSAISVSPAALPNPTVGSAYSQHLTASGGSGSGYHYSATGLPAGFSISPDGLITGTPTSGAPATVFVTVTDGNGASITERYSLTPDSTVQRYTGDVMVLLVGTADLDPIRDKLQIMLGDFAKNRQDLLDGKLWVVGSDGLQSWNPRVGQALPQSNAFTRDDSVNRILGMAIDQANGLRKTAANPGFKVLLLWWNTTRGEELNIDPKGFKGKLPNNRPLTLFCLGTPTEGFGPIQVAILGAVAVPSDLAGLEGLLRHHAKSK